jgi:hypothetical protein
MDSNRIHQTPQLLAENQVFNTFSGSGFARKFPSTFRTFSLRFNSSRSCQMLPHDRFLLN